jgi:sarcosine oxidase subunit gamma
VERQYVAIALSGSALPDLLRQTCNVNFQALSLGDRPVVMTMMIGVSVTVIPGDRNGIPFYQVWGDRSYGPYLWQTLAAIVQELGGIIVGIDQIM